MIKTQKPVKNNKAILRRLPFMHWAYCNRAFLSWSSLDVTVVGASLVDERTEKNEGIIEIHTALRMPWTQAKHLALKLTEVVDEYERINGPLVEPEVPFIGK